MLKASVRIFKTKQLLEFLHALRYIEAPMKCRILETKLLFVTVESAGKMRKSTN